MDARTLELPKHFHLARYVDGMREVVAYDIGEDLFVARWDTVINGEQCYTAIPLYGRHDLEAALEELRPVARDALLAESSDHQLAADMTTALIARAKRGT